MAHILRLAGASSGSRTAQGLHQSRRAKCLSQKKADGRLGRQRGEESVAPKRKCEEGIESGHLTRCPSSTQMGRAIAKPGWGYKGKRSKPIRGFNGGPGQKLRGQRQCKRIHGGCAGVCSDNTEHIVQSVCHKPGA